MSRATRTTKDVISNILTPVGSPVMQVKDQTNESTKNLADVPAKDLETLVGSAVKKHFDEFRLEMRTLFLDQLGNMEGRIKELESRVQDMERDLNEKSEKILRYETATDSMTSLPKSDTLVLKPELDELKSLARAGSIAANDCEQYSRRCNIRIRGLVTSDVESVTETVTHFINTKLQMPKIKTSDIEAAHPLPFRGKSSHGSTGSQTTTVLVRFSRRDVRDAVISARKLLKKSNISISDDLTSLNAQLLTRLQNNDRIINAWSWRGKIIAKLTETKSVTVKPYQSVDELFRMIE